MRVVALQSNPRPTSPHLITSAMRDGLADQLGWSYSPACLELERSSSGRGRQPASRDTLFKHPLHSHTAERRDKDSVA